MFRTIKIPWLILFLVVTGVIIYANILPNEMFWDDNDFILNNRFIKDWHYWPLFFTDNLLAGTHLISTYWRPLLQTLFALEWHGWAGWTPGWHAVSMLLHMTNAALVLLLLRRLFTSTMIALAAALIFLVHPLQTETVAYANSQGDSLALLFILLGLGAFGTYRSTGRRRFYIAALCCSPLALMSKEIGILLLPLLLLCDLFANAQEPTPLRKQWPAWIPFLVIALIYALLRATVLHFGNTTSYYPERPDFQTNILVRIFTFLKSLPEYAGLILWPADLKFDRPVAIADLRLTPMIVLGGALITGLGTVIWKYRRTNPALSFGVAWTVLTLFPFSNIPVIINGLFYEHFLYIPLIGVGAMTGALLPWPDSAKGRQVLSALLIIVIGAWGARTILRNADWRTATGFYEKTARHNPGSYRIFNNLGMAYADKGQLEKARAAYTKATEIDPANSVAWHNLGNLARAEGRRDDAIACFERAIMLQRNFIFSYNALAQLYIDTNDPRRARAVLKQSLPYSDDPERIRDLINKLNN